MEEEKNVNVQSTLPPKITKENIDPDAGTRRGAILSWVRSIIYTLLSSFLISVAVRITELLRASRGLTLGILFIEAVL